MSASIGRGRTARFTLAGSGAAMPEGPCESDYARALPATDQPAQTAEASSENESEEKTAEAEQAETDSTQDASASEAPADFTFDAAKVRQAISSIDAQSRWNWVAMHGGDSAEYFVSSKRGDRFSLACTSSVYKSAASGRLLLAGNATPPEGSKRLKVTIDGNDTWMPLDDRGRIDTSCATCSVKFEALWQSLRRGFRLDVGYENGRPVRFTLANSSVALPEQPCETDYASNRRDHPEIAANKQPEGMKSPPRQRLNRPKRPNETSQEQVADNPEGQDQEVEAEAARAEQQAHKRAQAEAEAARAEQEAQKRAEAEAAAAKAELEEQERLKAEAMAKAKANLEAIIEQVKQSGDALETESRKNWVARYANETAEYFVSNAKGDRFALSCTEGAFKGRTSGRFWIGWQGATSLKVRT